MESRIAELEMKLAQCDDSIDALNRMVFRQQQQLELLQGQLRELYRMIRADDSVETSSLRDELPPHY